MALRIRQHARRRPACWVVVLAALALLLAACGDDAEEDVALDADVAEEDVAEDDVVEDDVDAVVVDPDVAGATASDIDPTETDADATSRPTDRATEQATEPAEPAEQTGAATPRQTSQAAATPSPTPGGSPAAAAQGGATDVIEIIETSFDLSSPRTQGDEEPLTISLASPGTYTFRAVNQADIVHALEVEGHGIEVKTGDIQPGGTAELQVQFPQAGEYDLYCPIANHKSLGMDGSVTIGG